MDVFKSYILQNWVLILVLIAFFIMIKTSAFLDKKATRRTYILIGIVFVLSILVFIEFYYGKDIDFRTARTVLMAIRYSSTPFIIAWIIYTLIKKQKSFIFILASILLIIDIVSIFTGIVFKVDDANQLVRGPLGYLPFIVTGLYCAFLIYVLIRRSNKRTMEIIPIVFLAISFISSLVFPFVLGSNFSQIFCPTIGVALFVYYVFLILQLSKKDALTGLLNRQAFNTETSASTKDITAIISIDMNGLKKINDTYGHSSGDEALVTLALCFARACRARQSVYRLGGDEFVILCRKTSEDDVLKIVRKINKYVSETKYSCSIGYCYRGNNYKSFEDTLKESDERMYEIKKDYYLTHKK